MELDYLYFNIRSKECQMLNNNNCDLIVNLPFTIEVNQNEYLNCEIISCEIPLSFYNISSDLINNIFSYTKIPTGSVSLTIPNGNYTVDSLMTTVNSLQSDFTISYNDITNKFLITLRSPITSITFTYNVNDYTQQIFGIVSTQTMTTATYFIGVCNLASVHSILVRSSLQTGHSASTSSTNNDIIGKIPLKVNAGGIIIFNNNDYTRSNIIKNSISQFYLRLTDQNTKVLNLNYCNWEMTIKFTKIKHDLNFVSEEQQLRRNTNYMPISQFSEPISQPPEPISQSPEPISQPPLSINEGVAPIEPPQIIDKNVDNTINEENTLTQPLEDPYENLDNLLYSLVLD
jgi:hypothetical protein